MIALLDVHCDVLVNQDVLWQAAKVSVASLFAYVPVVPGRDLKFKSLLVFHLMTAFMAHVCTCALLYSY